jgi:hypothetical protein
MDTYYQCLGYFVWPGKLSMATALYRIFTEPPFMTDLLEILNILWNPKIHLRVQKRPPLNPILRQINKVHATPSWFSKIHVLLPSYIAGSS